MIAVAALLVTVVVFLTGSSTSKEFEGELVHTIQRGDLAVTVTEQGTLESSNNIEIRNKVRGFSVVTEVVEVGEVVKKGDILVRLDTKAIEDQLSTARTNVNTAKANLARSTANVESNAIAEKAYLEGQYASQLAELQRAVSIAEARLSNAGKVAKNTQQLYQMSFTNRQELDAHDFQVTQFELELAVKRNAIKVLNSYTKEMQLATLRGNLEASRTKQESDQAALEEEVKRMARLEQELKDCVIKAPRDGLVIYPSAAAWKETPDIDEGASVRMDQVLLLMPDLDQMQIKVGIHESIVDQLKLGMKAKISFPDQEEPILAEVSKIANVTKPAGWWTGNVVKYDTIIKLPVAAGLKPGMTAKVEVVLAEHFNVVKIPVAAVVQVGDQHFCWVVTEQGSEKRELNLGASDDIFIVAKEGVAEGEKVVLNPLARVEEAQSEAQKLINQSRSFAGK